MAITGLVNDALAEALKETFPASDPISVQQPLVAGREDTLRTKITSSTLGGWPVSAQGTDASEYAQSHEAGAPVKRR
jgi:hypothetical protein